MQWKITREDQLESVFNESINPFWHHQVIEDEITAKDGVVLKYAYSIPAHATATVVLSSGRIETYLKYKEMMFDLWQNGFAVFIIDHRGQGLSGRMVENPQLGYVADFDEYVEDLNDFIQQIVKPRQVGELHLVAHSMGSCIGALTLMKYPELFKKAVLCAPMFGVKPALPNWLGNSLIRIGLFWNAVRKKEAGYFFGQTDYIAYPFKINPLCHSEARYRVFRDLYEDMPETQLGGVTTEWLKAAQFAMNDIQENAGKIQTPTLVFCADADMIIDNKRQSSAVAKMPNAEYRIVKKGFHELFNETDEYRLPVMTELLDFLAAE